MEPLRAAPGIPTRAPPNTPTDCPLCVTDTSTTALGHEKPFRESQHSFGNPDSSRQTSASRHQRTMSQQVVDQDSFVANPIYENVINPSPSISGLQTKRVRFILEGDKPEHSNDSPK